MVVSCGLLPVSNLSQSTKSYGGTTGFIRKKSDADAPTAASAGEIIFIASQLDN